MHLLNSALVKLLKLLNIISISENLHTCSMYQKVKDMSLQFSSTGNWPGGKVYN